jgi:hypothetical protein
MKRYFVRYYWLQGNLTINNSTVIEVDLDKCYTDEVLPTVKEAILKQRPEIKSYNYFEVLLISAL